MSLASFAAPADPGAIIQGMQPTPGQPDEEEQAEAPINVQVQDFIARWKGVALTAPASGWGVSSSL